MQCLYPRKVWLRDKGEGKYLHVPCGTCLHCRINRTREWTQRLLHETYYSTSAYFITLTYNEENVPLDDNGNEAVCKRDIQLFLKRLRKAYPETQIRYFVGSEYGPQTGRPHYHGILYNLPEDALQPSKHWTKGQALNKGDNFINRKLNDIWNNGYITISRVTRERAGYCAKYFVDKKEVDELLTPNFSLMSRRPGIGRDHCDSIAGKVRAFGLSGCLTDRGTYVALPRYYRNKIYTGDELKDMYLDKVDELNERYETPNEFNLHPDHIEALTRRAMTWKGKKSKI